MLNWRIKLQEISGDGSDREKDFPADERAELAGRLGIVGVDALRVAIRIAPTSRDRYRLTGEVKAVVVQTCGVTLEPVQQAIREPLDQAYERGRVRSGLSGEAAELAGEISIDPMADDPPEIISGDAIDAGPIIEETVAMALDPFPRKPDAALDVSEAGNPEAPAAPSPFAALADLKTGDPDTEKGE